MLLNIYAPTKYTLPENPKKNGSVEIGIKISACKKICRTVLLTKVTKYAAEHVVQLDHQSNQMFAKNKNLIQRSLMQ